MKSIHVRRLENRVSTTAARLVDYCTANRITVADLAQVRLPWYEIRNQAGAGAATAEDVPTVFIFDEIGGSLGVSAKRFVAELEEIDAPLIRVRINSPGGSVFDAITIHSALLHHPAKIQVYIDGVAASAASVIAMGGDEVIMMPGSQMMIHDASMLEDGNEADHAKASTFLGRQSENIAGMYQRRGGGEAADWRELMLAETWAFADEAVELGLADRTEHDRGELLPVQERMTRAFDLSRYRYEGRSAAPAPAPRGANAQRRPAQTRSEDRMSPALTRPRLSSDAELRHAALERAAAATARPGHLSVARRTAPSGVSSARTAAFAATLTAKLVEWNGQKRYHLMGHASVVEVEYDMWDDFGPYKEVVDRAGFSKTLANEPDVAYLVNHRGITMARTTNGSLVLGMDDLGLATEAWLNPKRQDVTDLVTAVEDRDVTEMSFAFMLVDGTWSPDFSTFRIHEVDLDRGDVSAVTYGANPYTDVAARSREVLSDLDRLPAGAARAALARLERRTDITRLAASYERELAEKPEAHESRAEITPIAAGRSITHIEALLLED